MAKLRVDKIAAPIVKDEFTGSVFFDGNGDHLDVPLSDDFQFGAGDFSIEAWVYLVEAKDQAIFGTNNSASPNYEGYELDVFTNGSVRFYSGSGSAYNYGALGLESSAGVVPQQTWTHLVISRQGNTLRLFVNGVLSVSNNSFSHTIEDSAVAPDIGNDGRSTGTSYHTHGYISNLRVCKGHAVYTSNFAPPTRELEVHQGPDDDRTVLLCCYDGENIFADKTGRHIIFSIGDRQSTPTQSLNNSPIGITTVTPGLTRNVDPTAGPTFQGGAGFTSQNWLTLPKGTTTDRNRTGGRGLFAIAGAQPASVNAISYIQISSSGNAQDFGDLSYVGDQATGVSSPTRGIFNNGANAATPTYSSTNVLDFVTIATTSNSVDFGDLTTMRKISAPLSNSTRGVFVGGINQYTSPYPSGTAPSSYVNTMDYITMATLGNAVDFGDSISSASSHNSATSNSTRGVYTISFNGSSNENTLYYITIATTGNGQNFGDLTFSGNRQQRGVISNGTRGIFGGALVGSPAVNSIDFITITTLGNGQDFGDLSYARRSIGGTSNSVRGVFAGGYDAPPGPLGRINTIDYINIASTGDAQEFGDLIHRTTELAGASDSHGGIS